MQRKTRTSNRNGGPKRPRPRLHAKAIRANPFTVLLDAVRHDTDNRLAGFLDAHLDAARPYGEQVVDLVAALRDLCLRGGKRLRPALLAVGYRAANASADIDPALEAGVALELLHAYFLIHDDWMDRDPVRRGGPAVHALLAKQYRSDWLGQSAAILAGDLGVALATEALSRVEVPPTRMPSLLAAFASMQADAVAGQQLDLLGSIDDVERTYELKTGSYTVRGPLLLGALLAGGSSATLSTLERFAVPCGVAFQLRDDLLSVFGDPSSTGKPFGSDVRSGKRTLLMSLGLQRSKGRQATLLRRTWGNAEATDDALRAVVGILDTCGAREGVEKRIEELVAQALSALDRGKLTTTGRELLAGAAEALAYRRT